MHYTTIDIETDGLDATVIHCVVCLDYQGNEAVFTSREGLTEYLQAYQRVVAHNGIQFDFPCLSKLWGVQVPLEKQYDTLIASRLSLPDREKGHSLESWGNRLGKPKMEQPESWAVFNEHMLEYCKQDVALGSMIYLHLQQELKDFSDESLRCEFMMQRLINKVYQTGFHFELNDAKALLEEIEQRQNKIWQQIDKVFKPEIVQLKTKTKEVPFNINSRDQIAKRLIELGWKPVKFTPSGKPKVDEIELDKCDLKEAKILAENFMLQKRAAMIKSWIKESDLDSRVRCYYHSLGAITNRMSCSNPNLQQVPSGRKPYGEQCRKLWSAPKGRVLVGSDAAGLELRVLAHYMKDQDYIKEILEGDIHTANQEAAGLSTRDQAKTFIYALCYGAGDGKLGLVVDGNARDGARLRHSFFQKIPAFKRFSDAVISKGEREGKLIAIDGRTLRVRSAHASLNTLIQGSSAVLMKNWFMNVGLNLKKRKLDANVIAMVHDEIIVECDDKVLDSVIDCVTIGISQVNNKFNLRCQLDCDVNVGQNWNEVH